MDHGMRILPEKQKHRFRYKTVKLPEAPELCGRSGFCHTGRGGRGSVKAPQFPPSAAKPGLSCGALIPRNRLTASFAHSTVSK